VLRSGRLAEARLQRIMPQWAGLQRANRY
jgi:hypothetical protein